MTKFRSSHPQTINSIFLATVQASPDRVYLDFAGDAFTYARMGREVESLARGLHALGLKRGDRAVTLLETGPDSIISWYAVNRLGAIHVPINTAYKGDYLRHQINDSGARIVICENAFVPHVTAIASQLTSVEHILHLGAEADRRDWRGGFGPIDEHRLTHGDAPYVEVAPSDLAAIIYTSGTTGLSKGCMASHNYLCDLARRNSEAAGRVPDDIQWTSLPLFHVGGICVVLQAIQLRASASVSRKFSVSGFWPEMERSKATHIMLIGSAAQMLANAPDTPLSLRCRGQIRILTAVPMSGQLAATWRERFGVNWSTGFVYGSTECGQALSAPYNEPAPDGSCGRANDAFDVRIVDEHDEELPANQVGEIVTRPKRPNVMYSGYWNNPEATAKASRNLWHHMGDQGRMDENGNVFFVDRSKDVIRRRGENISTFELEGTFGQNPHIAEVAVHSVPSELLEDDVKVTAVLLSGTQLKESDLWEWARARIPRFAVPRYVEFRNELPRNATGRVLKFQLREEGVTKATWDSQN
jgi:crotonobetaine/carnitine-CoA ligase